jgi:hypothetical protein
MDESRMLSSASPSPTPQTTLEKAAVIPKSEFVRTIGPLDNFDVTTSEQAEAWQVEVRLKRTPLEGGKATRLLDGGGAIYLINKETGTIVDRKLMQ